MEEGRKHEEFAATVMAAASPSPSPSSRTIFSEIFGTSSSSSRGAGFSYRSHHERADPLPWGGDFVGAGCPSDSFSLGVSLLPIHCLWLLRYPILRVSPGPKSPFFLPGPFFFFPPFSLVASLLFHFSLELYLEQWGEREVQEYLTPFWGGLPKFTGRIISIYVFRSCKYKSSLKYVYSNEPYSKCSTFSTSLFLTVTKSKFNHIPMVFTSCSWMILTWNYLYYIDLLSDFFFRGEVHDQQQYVIILYQKIKLIIIKDKDRKTVKESNARAWTGWTPPPNFYLANHQEP
uniref:Serine-rich protein n=1 Tax=Oryza coarctata TaxID=77588 RepID=Q9XEL5_ORYCO|nr:serine-rich protein [Oryza coarctata]